ncbi:adenosine deaminase 2-A [Corythoichthys intestinalis]|uniref:adenosine deaminase 2-A n=1 Tax=Corythoichthys intestinalis TaxID=161448 RepID=UPI0025A5CB59|nr:adenosine deaminase 2-A [Corythoichthys intestinalis]XP_057691680.1 adenosine deaminase 2-A [Corythoichthys intestinalis]XP_061813205.1 adenosine deaminase 2-A-like [Nerophis lumbriciformis]
MVAVVQRPHVAVFCLPLLIAAGVMPMPDPKRRDALIQLEASQQTGGQIVLSDLEKLLDARLYQMKQDEMANAHFPPAMHFFKAKPLIERSPIFSLLQKMPKGGALHVHDLAMGDPEWLVKNVTYRSNCYMCVTDKQAVRFIFSSGQPAPAPNCSAWMLMETLRNKLVNVTDLDNSILANMTLFTDDDPEALYPHQAVVWERFQMNFMAVMGLITYAPVFRDYYYHGLSQFYKDNVMYLEIRALLLQTYELDGSTHDSVWALQTYGDVTKRFISDHPDFFGSRFIFIVHRTMDSAALKGVVKKAIKLQKDFPDLMVGFDLVGRVDDGKPLWYFRDALSLPSQMGVTLPYFFHAGETNLEGTDVDQNLLDAILFNTSRIGHGFALTRHPLARELSRKRGVAVEVCPISNQVLKLVDDLRNHPAATLMSQNHPMVISSDDPAMFGSSGLSYDFYEAFVGFGGNRSNLGTLKQLAINSILYSALKPELQNKALDAWERKWDTFVSENAFQKPNCVYGNFICAYPNMLPWKKLFNSAAVL